MSEDPTLRELALPSAPDAALQQLVGGATRCAALAAGRWLTREQLQQNLHGEAEGWLRRATDAELARAYAAHFRVEGTQPDEYKNRLFEADTGVRLLTGIRFRGLDLARPFVELIWHDILGEYRFRDNLPTGAAPLPLPGQLTRVLDALLHAYRAFAPHYVTLFWPEAASAAGALLELPGFTLQDQLVAAPVRQLAQTAAAHQELVVLQPARAAALYERYSREYAELHARSPELRDATRAESLEALEDTEREGLLFQIFVAGEAAGVYALESASRAGLGGYQVQEILLYQPFRRRGLAPAVHVAACRQLQVGPECLLWGVIGAANSSSLRTALRAGRRVVGGTYRYRAPG